MAEGFNKALTILVEDQAAKFILTELLRHRNDAFLRTVAIAVAGEVGPDGRPRSSGKDAIRNTMISLSQAGLRIAAVLDGGENIDAADPRRFIFKLPGDLAPEEALFQCDKVRTHLSQTYPILDLNALEAELRASDCHGYFKEIGHKVDCEEPYLLREAARVYAPQANANEVNALFEQLKDAAGR